MLITRSELGNLISTAYWSAFAIVLVIVLLITFKISRTAKGRAIGSLISLLVVAGVFSIPFIPKSPKTQQMERNAERQHATISTTGEAPFRPVSPTKSNYKIAKALFDEKCKTAGEKIYRTVDDVEGVTLLKMPKPYKNAYSYEPMWEEAAISQTTEYIFSFLGVTYKNFSDGKFLVYDKPKSKKYYLSNLKKYKGIIFGYQFVDVNENNFYIRYTLPWGEEAKIATPLQAKPTRYAVTYETIVDPEERKYWIANAAIKIIDTKNNSLMAEKIIYVFDHGLGGGARGTSGRQPWTHAKKCKQNPILNDETRFFVEKVLKPKQPNFNVNNGE